MRLDSPLGGDAIVLRTLAPEDVTAGYLAWLHDADVNRYLEVRFAPPGSIEELAAFVASANASDDTLLLGIFLRAARRHIGNIKLGPDDSEPEFSTFSWVSMMFATGMGIGLMFWGVAEPLTHFNAPPMGLAEPGSPEAAQLAMEYSFFHWGFHPWSMYAVIGLSIGYFAYRKGYGNLVSATFRPLLGDRASQGPGKAIDVIAPVLVACVRNSRSRQMRSISSASRPIRAGTSVRVNSSITECPPVPMV